METNLGKSGMIRKEKETRIDIIVIPLFFVFVAVVAAPGGCNDG